MIDTDSVAWLAVEWLQEEMTKVEPPIVCLPLMRLPAKPVEKAVTDHMADLLARTCASLRLRKAE